MTGLKGVEMNTWSVQKAKARFSELLDACLAEGPQMVTRRGTEAAVLVPVQEWRRMQSAARPSLKQLLLSDQARADMIVPPRGQDSWGSALSELRPRPAYGTLCLRGR